MLLYIHIPYCDSKCHYCSFNSYTGRFDTRPDYMKALHRQLLFELERFEATPGSIETLFIGGGTPSTVPPELYAPLFETLKPYLASEAELNCEANPNSASDTWLKGMKALGINRISFGVQSFDPDKLKRLGRAHTPRQAIEAVERAADIGFKRLSLDLIYNCAGDDRELLNRDLDIASDLPVGHLSAYELTIEEGTPFAQTPDVRQENVALARWMARAIEERGLPQYEISNFGDPCRHNLGYWQLKDYIGLGAGAVGFRQDRRYYPPTALDRYLANPLSHRTEILSAEDLKTERLFLGLRSRLGVDEAWLSPSERERARLLVREGKLLTRPGGYRNPDLFLADELVLFLMD
ncbi:radical SAM family heme chaperone HemW [Nitratifractor salsuginis]|uniref:Heme chaperone HemW n=1 Tax=Nitratifractor salsuginis (strain DSM 16511 / JCM 12458 / E9I37-1) TaxID=749222 RepID=E6X1H1_NITSE|nr:radical SAM family heme chaperone HemW [Nitratifractor salsuginis]ADV45904.1 oxygen-independent coproporphyrinogen III oxidase [Nitratifractor salsuginis DSM 16511]